ncbi:MAG TPA: SIS domain-containing protein [Dermatophilaceae bacterium]|nr:SIS domain-containing protein [Dermatophilaceae bacterium]
MARTRAGTQMGREIAEQPRAVEATLAALLPLRSDVRRLAGDRRRVLFVARGSSDNAAVYGRYLLEAHSGVNAALAAPSIATHYRSRLDLSDAVVVCVSQSGQTEEIVATQAWARDCGAATVAVTNRDGSPLAQQADLALVTSAGPELAVPATKTYTTQLAAMAVLATALAPHPSSLDADLHRVPAELQVLIDEQRGVEAAAAALAGAPTVVVSGRGLVLGTAQEIALKMEETCLRPVRGYSYADLRHGPISVVTGGVTAVLVAAQDGPLVEAMTELAGDLRRRGAQTIGLGGDAGFAAACDLSVPGPDLTEPVAPIALVVPAQLVIEQLALRLGLDPDAPRGLAKVTQTEADS